MILAAIATAAILQGADVVWIPPPPDRVDAITEGAPENRIASSGRFDIRCRIDTASRLTACKVLSKKVVGADLSSMALKMASIMAVQRLTRSGEAVAGRLVEFPIVFEPPEGD